MFGLFKKKGEQPEEEQRVQNPENKQFKAFAAKFLPEELTILAVTGANGFGGGKTRGETLWTASIGLTAWMEEDSPDIHRGEFVLSTIGDEQLLEVLRRRTRPDFIIKFRGRASEDGKRLLLLDLPEPGFDPDLKAILEEQKKPVTFWEEGLGTFTLNRQVDWFETEVDWLGGQISLVFDAEEDRAEVLQRAKTLLAGAASWDKRVREYAADDLLASANDWAEDEEITREQFIQRMELESIEIRADGSFEFWFADGDMFYGHSIHVSGDMEHGPDDAAMEG
ncbi:MAG: DUF2262 domain-containing protein [Lawsonibacter sp.]|jgi:hypothetical protein|nr:DUF2262 domain-containing protein [Lawsonibacter sp.]